MKKKSSSLRQIKELEKALKECEDYFAFNHLKCKMIKINKKILKKPRRH